MESFRCQSVHFSSPLVLGISHPVLLSIEILVGLDATIPKPGVSAHLRPRTCGKPVSLAVRRPFPIGHGFRGRPEAWSLGPKNVSALFISPSSIPVVLIVAHPSYLGFLCTDITQRHARSTASLTPVKGCVVTTAGVWD